MEEPIKLIVLIAAQMANLPLNYWIVKVINDKEIEKYWELIHRLKYVRQG